MSMKWRHIFSFLFVARVSLFKNIKSLGFHSLPSNHRYFCLYCIVTVCPCCLKNNLNICLNTESVMSVTAWARMQRYIPDFLAHTCTFIVQCTLYNECTLYILYLVHKPDIQYTVASASIVFFAKIHFNYETVCLPKSEDVTVFAFRFILSSLVVLVLVVCN